MRHKQTYKEVREDITLDSLIEKADAKGKDILYIPYFSNALYELAKSENFVSEYGRPNGILTFNNKIYKVVFVD